MAKYEFPRLEGTGRRGVAPEIKWPAIVADLSEMREALGGLSLRPESFALIGHIASALALVETVFMTTHRDES